MLENYNSVLSLVYSIYFLIYHLVTGSVYSICIQEIYQYMEYAYNYSVVYPIPMFSINFDYGIHKKLSVILCFSTVSILDR